METGAADATTTSTSPAIGSGIGSVLALGTPAADGPDLAELAVIERTATSRLIDKMAARGLVAKEALENDRRFMRITITEAGRTAYEAADKAAQSARQRLFAGLSDDDITQMLRMLRQMQANSERPQHLAQVLPIRATAS